MAGLSYPTASTVNDVPTMDFLRYSANLTSSELADPNKAELGSNYDQNPDWSANNDAVPFQGALNNYTRRISENQVAMYDPTGKYTGVGSTEGGGWMGKHGQDLAKTAIAAMALYGGYSAMTGAGVGTTAGTGAYAGEGALSGIIPGVAEGTVAGATTAGATGLAGTLAGAGTIAGAGAGAAGLGTLGSLASLASIGSGIYGMYKANQLTDQAQTNADKAAPWTSGVVTPGSGQQVAGDALKNVISGDFSNDAGFKLAQLSAARTSAQQPGGYSASAAANAAIKYQNDRILALSAPAGVGYNPSASAATAGTQAANTLAGQSLGSIGFGLSGAGAVSPQLQALLLKYGLV